VSMLDLPPTRVAMEAGVHSIWISEQLQELGHEVFAQRCQVAMPPGLKLALGLERRYTANYVKNCAMVCQKVPLSSRLEGRYQDSPTQKAAGAFPPLLPSHGETNLKDDVDG
jgi:hypothetical protein